MVRRGPSIPLLSRGEETGTTLFQGRRTPMRRTGIRRRLTPLVTGWIAAACLWKGEAARGDHRFLIFSIDVTPDVQVYVQFWSEPDEPVLWEVSSGRWNPPTDQWLAGERSRRIEALGFATGGEAGNFQRSVRVRTRADVRRLARLVVNVFHDGFDYRGRQPVDVFMAYESRAASRLVYDAFTVDDLVALLRNCGFDAEVVNLSDDGPVLTAVRRGIRTTVICADRVPDQDLYLRVVLRSESSMWPGVETSTPLGWWTAPTGVADDLPPLESTLTFDGGVTAEWVMRRLKDWDEVTWSMQVDSRRRSRAARTVEVVH